jgi:hypothetical protein
MKRESLTQPQPKNLTPHYLSAVLKREMEQANKQPPDTGSFLDRLPKK